MKKVVRLNESELINIIKQIVNEQDNDRSEKLGELIFNFIDNQFKGMKRRSWGWDIQDTTVLEYVNKHFLIDYNLFKSLQSIFSLTEKEAERYYLMYFRKRFPRYDSWGALCM